MLKNDKQRRICKKYSSRDEEGYVHCMDCPLRVISEESDVACKANSHYDRKEKEWVTDK